MLINLAKAALLSFNSYFMKTRTLNLNTMKFEFWERQKEYEKMFQHDKKKNIDSYKVTILNCPRLKKKIYIVQK